MVGIVVHNEAQDILLEFVEECVMEIFVFLQSFEGFLNHTTSVGTDRDIRKVILNGVNSLFNNFGLI